MYIFIYFFLNNQRKIHWINKKKIIRRFTEVMNFLSLENESIYLSVVDTPILRVYKAKYTSSQSSQLLLPRAWAEFHRTGL